MILRRYTNANGEQQEITLSAEQWEALGEKELANMLGFGKPLKAEPETVAQAAPAAKKAPAKKGK